MATVTKSEPPSSQSSLHLVVQLGFHVSEHNKEAEYLQIQPSCALQMNSKSAMPPEQLLMIGLPCSCGGRWKIDGLSICNR
jgi:hypothetical protein